MRSKKNRKDVCGALICKNGRFLIARRKLADSFGGLWEFPGGSLESGEKKQGCLKREIKEELGVDIQVGKLIYSLEDEIPDLKINVFLFACKIKRGIPRAVDCQELRWADLNQLKKFNLAPADRKILTWLLEGKQIGNQVKAKRQSYYFRSKRPG